MNQSESEPNIHVTGVRRGKTRASKARLVLVWLPFHRHGLRKWRELSEFPINHRAQKSKSKANEKISFDIQFKSALKEQLENLRKQVNFSCLKCKLTFHSVHVYIHKPGHWAECS